VGKKTGRSEGIFARKRSQPCSSLLEPVPIFILFLTLGFHGFFAEKGINFAG
jgi:hypothetical protein